MDKLQDTLNILKEYKQDHIIRLLEKLNKEQQDELIKQIATIDFHQIMELYNNTKKTIEFKESKIEPLKYLDKAKLTEEQRNNFDELGEKAVRNGEYAVVTMAGGQGTRLGHHGPKGTFKLNVYGKGKYLFEILAENLKDANMTGIDSTETKEKLDKCIRERRCIYNKVKRTKDPVLSSLHQQDIAELTQEIKTLRNEVKLYESIKERSVLMKQKLKLVNEDERRKEKEQWTMEDKQQIR